MIATFLSHSDIVMVLQLDGMITEPPLSTVPFKLMNDVNLHGIIYDTIIFSEGNITVVTKENK